MIRQSSEGNAGIAAARQLKLATMRTCQDRPGDGSGQEKQKVEGDELEGRLELEPRENSKAKER